ncbi:MAG: O-antigen ligase family protein [Caulobacteraceae bacterium]
MTSADQPRNPPPRPLILPPYSHDPDSPGRRRARRWAVGLLAAFSFFWGLVFAFLAPALILILLAPVGILMLVAIWALPDLKTAPARLLRRMFLAYVAIAVLWPFYISIAIPHSGLPWIGPARLIFTPMVIVFLICLAVSKDLRGQLAVALKSQRLIPWLLAAFVIIQTYSVLLSDRFFASLNKWVDAQFTWTCVFFIACYLFTRPGLVRRWATILWACAVIACLIALWEWRIQHVPWFGHLPAFLQMDPIMAKAVAPNFRNYTTVYRVRSTFQSALGLGEYMSLTIPFVLCFAFGPFGRKVRLAALASIPLICFVVFISHARSGVIGVLIDFALYGFYWGVMQWRRDRANPIGIAVLLSYPVVAALAVASTFFIGRIHASVWGSGETVSSTEARTVQYQMGIPKVLSHPWGYGIGRGADTLGFFTPGGLETIDTYYLLIALDYGVVGFLVFYSLILYSIYAAGRYSLKDHGHDRETLFLPAAGIALASFFVIKSVYSEVNNHSLYFMVLGMVVALIYRVKNAGPLSTGAPRNQTAPAAERLS